MPYHDTVESDAVAYRLMHMTLLMHDTMGSVLAAKECQDHAAHSQIYHNSDTVGSERGVGRDCSGLSRKET
jgi:hypothetical protein